MSNDTIQWHQSQVSTRHQINNVDLASKGSQSTQFHLKQSTTIWKSMNSTFKSSLLLIVKTYNKFKRILLQFRVNNRIQCCHLCHRSMSNWTVKSSSLNNCSSKIRITHNLRSMIQSLKSPTRNRGRFNPNKTSCSLKKMTYPQPPTISPPSMHNTLPQLQVLFHLAHRSQSLN